VQQVIRAPHHQEGLFIPFSLLGEHGSLRDFLGRLEVSKEEANLWALGIHKTGLS